MSTWSLDLQPWHSPALHPQTLKPSVEPGTLNLQSLNLLNPSVRHSAQALSAETHESCLQPENSLQKQVREAPALGLLFTLQGPIMTSEYFTNKSDKTPNPTEPGRTLLKPCKDFITGLVKTSSRDYQNIPNLADAFEPYGSLLNSLLHTAPNYPQR